MGENENVGVQLAGGKSATAHLHEALLAAVAEYPEVLGDAGVPDEPAAFKSSYPDVLPRFEARRVDSERRSDIARTIVSASDAAMVVEPSGRGLTDAVRQPADPFDLQHAAPVGSSRLMPRVPFAGTTRSGAELVAAVAALVDRGSASSPVLEAVSWLVDTAGADGIDLSGRRIAMFGAGAELAPTRLWLEGGAEVLWIDVTDPPADLVGAADLSGSLHWVDGGADLLTEPHRVRATIEQFAGDGQIDLGLYAYAPGRAREWRLTATMNAIVDALPAGTVRGTAMLLSPTTCGVLSFDDLARETQRRASRPRWQSALDTLRVFGRGDGHVTSGSTSTNRGIVSIQGGSYQAAQYIGKILAAEVWATADPPIAVSANTAGVSLTESIQHPVFDIAFAGARSLDVETFEPATTAALNGLLTLHDRSNPAVAERPLTELFDTRVHGGVYVAPYPIDPALRVAAAIGILKDPRRIGSLIRR
jgi:hypothetical protein